MEVGKLYKTKCLYWILYSSEDEIDIFRCAITSVAAAQYWSTRIQNLTYIHPNSLFLLLEQKQKQKQKHCKVLSPEGNIGWIHLADWCRNDIEEAKAE
jgi:hypothetical protein